MRPNLNVCAPQYLVYFLLNPSTKNNILSNYKSGTGVPRIVLKDFKKIKINLPDLEDQKSVVRILSSIDNMIDLNNNINRTLRSIAQAIFKSWFVDFDPVHAKANASSEDEYDVIAKELGISREILNLFPSEFEETELGLIPKGWEVIQISKISKLNPKSWNKKNFPHTVNYIDLTNVKEGNITEISKNISMSQLQAEQEESLSLMIL